MTEVELNHLLTCHMLAMLYDLKDFSIYTSLYCALTVYFVLILVRVFLCFGPSVHLEQRGKKWDREQRKNKNTVLHSYGVYKCIYDDGGAKRDCV